MYSNVYVCVCVHTQSLSYVWLFETPWTVALQAPLSVRFLRQGYWSGLPFPSPGDRPNPRIEPMSPELAGRFFTNEAPGKLSYYFFILAWRLRNNGHCKAIKNTMVNRLTKKSNTEIHVPLKISKSVISSFSFTTVGFRGGLCSVLYPCFHDQLLLISQPKPWWL